MFEGNLLNVQLGVSSFKHFLQILQNLGFTFNFGCLNPVEVRFCCKIGQYCLSYYFASTLQLNYKAQLPSCNRKFMLKVAKFLDYGLTTTQPWFNLFSDLLKTVTELQYRSFKIYPIWETLEAISLANKGFEKTLIIKGHNGTPGEKEMRGTRSVRDKDPSENTTESKEVVNGKRRENNNDKTIDNISSQNNSNNNNSRSNNIKNGSSNNNNSRSNNIKNGSNNNNSSKENISKNIIGENIRISRKNNKNEKNNDNSNIENFNGDNSIIVNKNNNVNTASTTIATTTTNKDESARGQQPQKLGKETKMKGTQRADGSFCFQTPSSQQNDLTDNLRNKLEAMPTPSNEKQQNDTIPHDTTHKKSRCRSPYDNVSLAETTPQTDEKRHEIHSEQERVMQEQPKPQNEEPVNASSEHNKLSNETSDRQISVWGRLWRHFPFWRSSWYP